MDRRRVRAGWGARPIADAVRAAALAEPELVTVRVREVVATPVEREIVVNGRTAPARKVDLRAESDGRVITLGSERGALVQAGELLIELDPRARAARAEEASAMLRMRCRSPIS